jgi:DNA-binding SARP family transcriptional activator
MAELSVTLFGSTEIEIDGRPLRKFRATKVQALLIYLLVQAGQVHQREALMALL